MTLFTIILLAFLAVLIGSIPVGLLLAKTKGLDIREQGTDNIGSTNVLRCFGKPLGITCFVLDMLKGYLPAALFPMLGAGGVVLQEKVPWIGILLGALAILGHNFPIFLNFKGGKGVATSAGVLLGIAPLAVFIGILTWAIVFWTSGYVSLGSILAAFVVVVIGWIAPYERVTALALTSLGALALYRHRSNINLLLAGTENRFQRIRNDSKSDEHIRGR